MKSKDKQKPKDEKLLLPVNELLILAKAYDWPLFSVTEIKAIFRLGEKAMARCRKLALKDPATDPWRGDLTRPEKFFDWYWDEMPKLEKKHPEI